jgi:hypothetical protein
MDAALLANASALHWSKTTSPASKHSPDRFDRFAMLHSSIVDDEGQIERRPASVPRVGPRSLADGGLPNWGLANRHLADLSLLIDGLRAWDIGGASGSHDGKRRTHYNYNSHHGTFLQLEEARFPSVRETRQ